MVEDHAGYSTQSHLAVQARTAQAIPVPRATGELLPACGGRCGRKLRLSTRQHALYRTKWAAPSLTWEFPCRENCDAKCLKMTYYVVSSDLAEAFFFALRKSLYTQSSKNRG
jgi:hypothetical protein